jgi:hypothetical protein
MFYRITAYNEKLNISVIMDTIEMFISLDAFDTYMTERGFKTIEIGSSNKFLDGNIKEPNAFQNNIILRACDYGKPVETIIIQNETIYKGIKVKNKFYIPDRNVLS